MAIKIAPEDALFSQLVRERAEWTCEICGRQYPEGYRQGLHCSHYFSRKNRSTRWDPENAWAHCFGCHQRMGGNPHMFREWVERKMGDRYADLVIRAHTPVLYKKPDILALRRHLKSQLDTMRARRANGETGRIEFTAFEIEVVLRGAKVDGKRDERAA